MAIWVSLIAQYGIPGAIQIYKILSEHFAENTGPTDEMWTKLQKVENDSHANFVKELSIPV
jgi:hypothetical protein